MNLEEILENLKDDQHFILFKSGKDDFKFHLSRGKTDSDAFDLAKAQILRARTLTKIRVNQTFTLVTERTDDERTYSEVPIIVEDGGSIVLNTAEQGPIRINNIPKLVYDVLLTKSLEGVK